MIIKSIGFKLFFLFFIKGMPAWAETPQFILSKYSAEASPERGKIFFNTQHIKSNGEKMSCSTCHGNDPKSTGQTRAHKEIKPIAWVANKERFTDPEKVEKWFKRNCNDVFERLCTNREKADFISYMISIK